MALAQNYRVVCQIRLKSFGVAVLLGSSEKSDRNITRRMSSLVRDLCGYVRRCPGWSNKIQLRMIDSRIKCGEITAVQLTRPNRQVMSVKNIFVVLAGGAIFRISD